MWMKTYCLAGDLNLVVWLFNIERRRRRDGDDNGRDNENNKPECFDLLCIFDWTIFQIARE